MAGQAGTDRWVMTGGIFLTGGCYLVTAAGLTGVRAPARALLAVAGLAGIGIAASPDPARGATPRHLAWTVLGAVTIAVLTAFAARRASSSRASVSSCSPTALITLIPRATASCVAMMPTDPPPPTSSSVSPLLTFSCRSHRRPPRPSWAARGIDP